MDHKSSNVNNGVSQSDFIKEKPTGLKTMQLNEQKAGMEGLDSKHINQIIYNASKGTSYFEFQEKRQEKIDKKVEEMMNILKTVTESQKTESRKKMDALASRLNAERDLSHTLVHFDMDAFYAAVEMRDNPELKVKPMAVGSLAMLSTSNYHARKFGVRAAMPGFIGRKLCPDLIIVPCNFKKYTEVSRQIRNIFKEYDPDFLPMGLDEAYLDLTDYAEQKKLKNLHKEPCDSDCDSEDEFSKHSYIDLNSISHTDSFCKRTCDSCINKFNDSLKSENGHLVYNTVQEIRNRIFETTQLTASAGIAPNMMLAKVCSDKNKPNGQFQIDNSIKSVTEFTASLPVRKVSGIGPVQGQLLNALGIQTCQDLWDKREILPLLFTPTSVHFYMRVALGIGHTEVKSDSIRKSKGVEETFKEMCIPEELHQKCQDLCEEVVEDLKSSRIKGKVVVLKIKTVKFDVHTRHSSLPFHTSDITIISREAKKLLDSEISAVHPESLKLRLMGVRICNLMDEEDDTKLEKHQITLKDFIHSRPSSSEGEAANTMVSEISPYLCPVCQKCQQNLAMLNSHLDNCLEMETQLENSQLRDNEPLIKVVTSSFSSCSSDEKLATQNELQASKPSISEQKDTSKDVTLSAFLDSSCIPKNMMLDAAKCHTHQHDTNIICDCLICPVCGKKQEIINLIDFNKHIDDCLSRSTIKELASQSPFDQADKRKRLSNKKKTKKVKLLKQENKKIEDFFQFSQL